MKTSMKMKSKNWKARTFWLIWVVIASYPLCLKPLLTLKSIVNSSVSPSWVRVAISSQVPSPKSVTTTDSSPTWVSIVPEVTQRHSWENLQRIGDNPGVRFSIGATGRRACQGEGIIFAGIGISTFHLLSDLVGLAGEHLPSFGGDPAIYQGDVKRRIAILIDAVIGEGPSAF